jgi:hypothetical protein
MPTQSSDVNAIPNGITYTAAGQTWKVLKGVSVTGSVFGVASGFANSTLNSNGSLYGATAGVFFDAVGAASNYVAKNGKKGTIAGDTAGVAMTRFDGSALVQNKGSVEGNTYGVYFLDYLGSARLVNHGDVEATGAAVLFQNGRNMQVENHGSIKAGAAGVYMIASGPPTSKISIENHGKIEADQFGIYVVTTTGSAVKIVNHKGATIEGASFAVGSAEKLNLKNEGAIKGHVVSGSFADKVVNKGKIKGDVQLGPGDDVFKMKGDKAKAGMIDMGPGNDLVVLGKKGDKVLFDWALNAATNVDTVKKFQSGKDKFYLDDDIFTTITPGTLSSAAFHKGTSAADADDRIIYDKKTGALYYDPDGVGGVAQTQFAKLDPGTKLKASDFTIGEYSIL